MPNDKNITVALVEYDIVWEDKSANYSILERYFSQHHADLFVLPEMFATGFSMNTTAIAEPPFGVTYNWMKQLAKQHNTAICGSVATVVNGNHYNRLYFVTQDEVFVYDKKHLFGFGKETDFYTAGNNIVEIDFLGWKIRLIVCYDLRFPVWCRNTTNYDLLLCIANWPKARINAWQTLLKARAIENMAYSIGVNRIGKDPFGLAYNGQSKVFDMIGNELVANNSVFYLNKNKLIESRQKFGFLQDKDDFKLL